MADSKGNRPNRPVRPRQAPSRGRKRRVVIDNAAARPRLDGRQSRDRVEPRPKAGPGPQPTGPVTVPSGVSVKDLSQALDVPAAQIIKILMGLGEMVTITQTLSDEAVQLIATEVNREVTIKHVAEEDELPEVFEDAEEDLVARPPVVTIMGHVDHGKTTLLDAIRESSVVETEAGGITQHIGAYQVEHNGRRITFLDTPGHEAFTAMRARGAKVTDIAVLVVAADDGVMPQTKESIAHARAAQVPIVVAVNKIDTPDANPERVRTELANEDLQPEEWGGETQFSDVSAKEKRNLDDLLERVLLVADAELELTANPKADASGPIIESRLDVGRGAVATMLIQRGTLEVGDAIVAGDAWGKVRALYNYRGEKVREARPGDPIEIIGFDKPPQAGEMSRVVENERQARGHANSRGERLRREQLAQRRPAGVSLESLFTQMQEGDIQDLNLVLKADVDGSVEAAVSELQKIQHPEVRVNVIHTGVGGISENDVMLAAASSGMVVGFNVRPNAEARASAEREGVEIRSYSVIYRLTEDIEQALVGMLKPVTTEETLGEAEVRQLFRVSRLGTIAGCMVTTRCRPPQRPGAGRARRHGHLRHVDRTAQALQGRCPRGRGRVRVRDPARGLQRREGRRHPRGLRGPPGRADRSEYGRRALGSRRSWRTLLQQQHDADGQDPRENERRRPHERAEEAGERGREAEDGQPVREDAGMKREDRRRQNHRAGREHRHDEQPVAEGEHQPRHVRVDLERVAVDAFAEAEAGAEDVRRQGERDEDGRRRDRRRRQARGIAFGADQGTPEAAEEQQEAKGREPDEEEGDPLRAEIVGVGVIGGDLRLGRIPAWRVACQNSADDDEDDEGNAVRRNPACYLQEHETGRSSYAQGASSRMEAYERRLRGNPVRRAALSRSGVAEGQAQTRQVRESPAPEPLRRVGGRGRPPRPLAAHAAHGRVLSA